MFSTVMLGLYLVLACLVKGKPIRRSGTMTEENTYILPIWEGALANHTESNDLAVLSDMKTLLGSGGAYTKLGWSFSSWALSRDISGAIDDYGFNPTNLNYMLNLGLTSSLPILVHMNDGRWADCCTPNSSGGWGDALLDTIAAQPNTTVWNSSGTSDYGHNGGSNYFSLTRLNTVYRSYKKRNVQSSASVIAAWANSNPTLFVGVSLDSETIMPNEEADYNPLAIEEWKMWLQNTGIYGPGGDYFGAGRVPAFPTIASLNAATGQSFASWDAMQPPVSIVAGDPFAEEWERWRVMMVLHSVSDETLWIAAAGIDRTLIFGHQTPRIDEYGLADDVMTETAANGAGGVTYYGWTPSDFREIDNAMRGAGKNNWGVFELNPQSTDSNVSYNTLLALYNDGIKIMCPNSWESDETTKDQYAIFDSPNYGSTFGLQLNQFLSNYGNTPRTLQPVPWNPGTRVYDFYDSFSTATSSGPDNHLEPAGSVGNVARKSVFSAVGAVITYYVSLPVVSPGQRLNFWTSLGIKDGAGVGGEAQFQVTINGNNLFGEHFNFNKNYWVWKRWVPIMVDVTSWAGEDVTFQFLTTGNDQWGWTIWGAPAVYSSTTGNNVALSAPVSVSSSDQDGLGWDPTYLTDGNVDSKTDGRIGWSSISHTSPLATEWVAVDLGSVLSIGKVVVFSRSDLVDFTGTGFPTAFQIQASTDSNNWTTLVSVTDYPRVQAGEGQIFTFVQASARFVRLLATELGGVGTESGYRFQLAEAEVYQ